MPSKMWRPDPLLQAQAKAEIWAKIHREAGRRGYACDPKLSNISRTYVSEVSHTYPLGDKFITRPNVAMAYGATPLECAVNCYRKIVPLDSLMAVLYLEAELVALADVARARVKLEETLDELSAIIPYVQGLNQ